MKAALWLLHGCAFPLRGKRPVIMHGPQWMCVPLRPAWYFLHACCLCHLTAVLSICRNTLYLTTNRQTVSTNVRQSCSWCNARLIWARHFPHFPSSGTLRLCLSLKNRVTGFVLEKEYPRWVPEKSECLYKGSSQGSFRSGC